MDNSTTSTMLTRDFTLIAISPTASSTDGFTSEAVDCEAERASNLVRVNENIYDYIRRTSGTRFLTERIFTLGCVSFLQICHSHATEATKQDRGSWIVLKSGGLYTAITGKNWFIPQDKEGRSRLLSAKEIDIVCGELVKNITKSRAHVRRNKDVENKVFFPQEFYVPILPNEFAKFVPIPNPSGFTSKLWEITLLLSAAEKVRHSARKLLLFLAAFFESSAFAPRKYLSQYVDIEEIKKKYTKKEAVEMFFIVMDALLSVVIAYARVATEISQLDTSQFTKDSSCRLLDCCNWEIMIDHVIRNGDAKARIIANQFLKDIENAEIICTTINQIAEAASLYKGLNDVIAGIDAEDNDKLLLAPANDKKALLKLVMRAKKNLKKAAAIEKRIAKDFS